MAFANAFKPAPSVRAMLNLGCGFDIPTGRYIKGKHGESILNGGLAHLTGVGGRGNTFKSTIMWFMMLRVMQRYSKSGGMAYDTEMSATLARLRDLAATLGPDAVAAVDDIERFILTDKTVYSGNVWYDMLKESLKPREGNKKDTGTTPMLNKEGEFIKALYPMVFGCDSLSQFQTDSLQKIQDNTVGDSGRNVEALRDAMAKNQMIMELPGVTARTGSYGLFSAHMGDEHQLDPYAPPQKKLAFLKNKVKFKNVPEKFTFLMNNCWYAISSEPLINQSTKGPEFPRHPDDQNKGDTDLMVVNLVNLRGKSGPTGLPITVVVSQTEGVLPGLSEFYFIKSMKRYGLGGNDRNYFLELCPDIALSRTTVRGKINEEPALRRALEIVGEMCQIKHIWTHLPRDFVPSPAELYETLKQRGYDWDVLLNTRGYWIFQEDKHELPFLSTMDLINMYHGTYHPYWMKEKPKGKVEKPVEKKDGESAA